MTDDALRESSLSKLDNGVPSTDDAVAAGPRLPTSKTNGASSRSPIATLFFLQVLSLVPAIVGCASCWSKAARPPVDSYSTRLDWIISSFWALATGYSSYSLAAGLLRRWLVFYDLLPAMLRLLGLQAFVWPLTHFTIVTVFPDHPVAGWIICALTAASCNVVQLWVTSNIRIHHAIAKRQGSRRRLVAPWAAAVPYLRQSASRAGTRTIDWSKVVRRTVLPLTVLGYGTLAMLLWQQYEARPAHVKGVFGGRLQPFSSSATTIERD